MDEALYPKTATVPMTIERDIIDSKTLLTIDNNVLPEGTSIMYRGTIIALNGYTDLCVDMQI
jgi:hypothetical protein